MSEYPRVDGMLARRLEQVDVIDLEAWVRDARADGSYPEAASMRVGGGIAVWFAPGHMVNSAFGLGLGRPVEKEEFAALLDFFAERGSRARVDVCPYSDRSLLRWLAEWGFVATDFETVLVQPLPSPEPAPPAPGVEVRLATTAEDRALWAELEARGFTEDAPVEAHHVLARSISVRPQVLPFVGYLDGEPAGTGMLTIVEGVAMFNGDSTLPSARGRGVQSALLAERLRHASAKGCDLAMIEASPGGVSERNQLRAGFRVAYTRVTLEQPADTMPREGDS